MSAVTVTMAAAATAITTMLARSVPALNPCTVARTNNGNDT
jgi:hypothetical protein